MSAATTTTLVVEALAVVFRQDELSVGATVHLHLEPEGVRVRARARVVVRVSPPGLGSVGVTVHLHLEPAAQLGGTLHVAAAVQR